MQVCFILDLIAFFYCFLGFLSLHMLSYAGLFPLHKSLSWIVDGHCLCVQIRVCSALLLRLASPDTLKQGPLRPCSPFVGAVSQNVTKTKRGVQSIKSVYTYPVGSLKSLAGKTGPKENGTWNQAQFFAETV